MLITSALLALLATTGASAGGPVYKMDGTVKYPICPESYDTYCCMTVAPYSTSCRGGRCTNSPGWSCLLGPGKVESMKYCMDEYQGDNKNPYCKRPGYEYFGSILKWTGSSFEPMLRPSDYRSYLRPGMHEPWVPSRDEIRWDIEAADGGKEAGGELRKRESDQDEVDMA